MQRARTLLVVDPRADWYVETLAPQFPELSIVGHESFPAARAQLAGAQILATLGMPLMGVHFTAEVAREMPQLEWVQCLVSGYDHVLRALEGRDDVLVTTMAGIHGPQMSELALLHMLALGRRLPDMLRNQGAHEWQLLPQRILESKVVGIVGTGAVGRHLAAVCKVFGMVVWGFTETVRDLSSFDRVLDRGRLVEAAAELDYLVLVVPASPATVRLVDRAVLAAMKPSAYLVNLARGSVIDEEALVTALRDGEIAGAGLDVFAVEPLPADSPLWDFPNVIVTPHTGGPHDRYAEQTLGVLEPNLRAYLDGRLDELVNVVAAPR